MRVSCIVWYYSLRHQIHLALRDVSAARDRPQNAYLTMIARWCTSTYSSSCSVCYFIAIGFRVVLAGNAVLLVIGHVDVPAKLDTKSWPARQQLTAFLRTT